MKELTSEGEALVRRGKDLVNRLLEFRLPQDKVRILTAIREHPEAGVLLQAMKKREPVKLATDLLAFYLHCLYLVEAQRLGKRTLEAWQAREAVKCRILTRVKTQEHFLIFDALELASHNLLEVGPEIEKVEQKLHLQISNPKRRNPKCSKTMASS